MVGNTIGFQNTSLGTFSQFQNTSGDDNAAVGYKADYWNDLGSRNTIIGSKAGYGNMAHAKTGNVFIGYSAGYYEVGDNKLYIENTSSGSPLIYGEFDNNLLRINGELTVTNKLGVGTNNASDMLHINADAGLHALRVQLAGITVLRVLYNGGTSLGTKIRQQLLQTTFTYTGISYTTVRIQVLLTAGTKNT